MKPMNFKDRWVLVTGASSGLGREMALGLLKDHGANVLAVARRKERLEALSAHGKVEVLPADLSKASDVEKVIARATDGRGLYGAVLNAGVTYFGRFDELSWDAFQTMLDTNVRANVRLSTALIPELERQGGGLMLVSSMTGATPVPFQTAYSATKAFLATFGTGLFYELKGRNVSVTTYAPGGIQTEMTEGESFKSLRGWLMPVDQAAREGLEALRKRKDFYVPGLVYRVGKPLIDVLPRRLVGEGLASVYGRALAKAKHP